MKLAEFVKQHMACIESFTELAADSHSNGEIRHELQATANVAFIEFEAQAMLMLGNQLIQGDIKVVDFVIDERRVWIRFSEQAFEHGHNVLVGYVYRDEGIAIRCSKVKFRKNKGV